MSIALEIISTVATAAGQFLFGLANLARELLPVIIDIKRISSYFTPINMLATYLGIPFAAISIMKILSKIDLPQNECM